MQSDTRAGNLDPTVVSGFGDEWSRFDQSGLSDDERARMFADYFGIFPWHQLPAGAVGVDVGAGSGRWALMTAPRVGRLHVVDASPEALAVARRNLQGSANVEFHCASVDALPFADGSLDFAYSLGVLHHVPDTAQAIRDVARKLKPGAPLLLYLYYRFDNRPAWFRAVWKGSELLRNTISTLPMAGRYAASQALAATVYFPLSRTARVLDSMGKLPANWPLAWYRNKSYYTLRTDALDRFGTRLEQRFTRPEIVKMMNDAGIEGVTFSDRAPFWCAVGTRRK